MTKTRFKVGIVGLAPGVSWASRSHVPALRSMPQDFELIGVANRSEVSARAAAEACGIPLAFSDATALCASPEIDIVAVTVRVQHHFALVKAALDAGKHVYCEWPLGNGLEESRQLAQMARQVGVLGVCGLQGRASIELAYIKSLVRDGYVGRIQSVSVIGASNVGLARIPSPYAYTADKRNGATALTISGGHLFSVLHDIFGTIDDISARLINRHSSAAVIGSDQVLPKTSEDQVLVHGLLDDGAPVSIHLWSGIGPGTGLLWEIHGEEGVIQVTGGIAHPHNTELVIRGARGNEPLQELPLPREPFEGWPEELMARNVARIYARMAEDLRSGSRTAPTFDDAVEIERVVAAVETAAVNGVRVSPEAM